MGSPALTCKSRPSPLRWPWKGVYIWNGSSFLRTKQQKTTFRKMSPKKNIVWLKTVECLVVGWPENLGCLKFYGDLSSLKVNPGVEFRRASQGVLTVPLFEVSNSSGEIRISKKTLFAIRPWNKFNCICGCSVVFRAWQYGVWFTSF